MSGTIKPSKSKEIEKMKKYDLSKIMKRAWELVKKAALSISDALKKSWKEIKEMVSSLEWKFTGTPKQVKYASDLMNELNKNIDREMEELVNEKMNFPRRIVKNFGSEENMKKSFKKATDLLKEYYARKAYQYMSGDAAIFLNHRWMFNVGRPVSNSNNIRENLVSLAQDICSGNFIDEYGIRKSINDYKNGRKIKDDLKL